MRIPGGVGGGGFGGHQMPAHPPNRPQVDSKLNHRAGSFVPSVGMYFCFVVVCMQHVTKKKAIMRSADPATFYVGCETQTPRRVMQPGLNYIEIRARLISIPDLKLVFLFS
jgi:hypothetical protein